MKILVTGAAGFIGFHCVRKLLQDGHNVVGIDNLNDYYDPSLKVARLKELGIIIGNNVANNKKLLISEDYSNFKFLNLDIEDEDNLALLFENESFNRVCHLAAQAGVRYSIENPRAYLRTNISGFLNILEFSRLYNIEHLVYASSSSVYGLNCEVPYSETVSTGHPVSIYAATKKSNELMAHVYSNMFKLPTTGLRFFTVYGPWGRPDMAPMLFANAILNNNVIKVYNNGDMLRDFTYIDDIANGVVLSLYTIAKPNINWNGFDPDPSSSNAPFEIYNIGNSQPIKLMDFIAALENSLGKNAIMEFLPMQAGDVYQTNANTRKIESELGFKSITPLAKGIQNFAAWYKKFYN